MATTSEDQHQPTTEQPMMHNSPRITSNSRALWEYIQHMERTKYANVNAIPTQGFLRSDVVLNIDNSVDFALLVNEQNQGQDIMPFEQRLQQNDAFYCTALALFFYKFKQGADLAETIRNRASAKMHQFASNEFGANAPSINAAFVGKFTLAQNETIFIRDLDVRSMMYADTAQQGLVTGDGSTAYAQDAVEGNRGFRNVEDPMMRLNGQSTVAASVKFPTTLPFQQEEEDLVGVALYMRGWRSQNSGVARISEQR